MAPLIRFVVRAAKERLESPALEPKDLVQYMNSGRGQGKKPDFAKVDDGKRILF